VTFSLSSFSIAGCRPFGGMMMKDRVVALSGLDEELLADDVLGLLDRWGTHLPTLRHVAQRWEQGDPSLVARSVDVDRLDIHCPYRPRQIFAVGANYRKHVIELIMADPDMRSDESEIAVSDAERRAAAERLMDERANNATPYCFSKLPSSLGGPTDPLVIPPDAHKIDWECELAVIIGKPARHVAAAEASEYIAGYAIANDVTARDLVFRRDVKALGTDWVSSKSQPGFTPFGPYLVPAEFVDPKDVTIRLSVNDRVMQNEHSGDMLIPIERQIEYLSSRVHLMPGDVICTGSPAGNGSHHGVFLKPGDHMVASISGLGEQRIDCI
jgi:2,4-diketo-3-deoxy-L-fuconate hydrolase